MPASVTEQLPLLGADGLAAVRAGAGRLAEDYGVPRAAVEHLLDRYGTLAAEVLDLIRADPGWPSRWPTATRTCGPRSPTRSPTRTRCTSRTC